MSDRQEIAARHGIPHMADQLAGDTAEALEADAAARAAITEMLGGELTYPANTPEPVELEPLATPSEWTDDRLQRMVEKTEANRHRAQERQANQTAEDQWQNATMRDVIEQADAIKAEHGRLIIERAHGISEEHDE